MPDDIYRWSSGPTGINRSLHDSDRRCRSTIISGQHRSDDQAWHWQGHHASPGRGRSVTTDQARLADRRRQVIQRPSIDRINDRYVVQVFVQVHVPGLSHLFNTISWRPYMASRYPTVCYMRIPDRSPTPDQANIRPTPDSRWHIYRTY